MNASPEEEYVRRDKPCVLTWFVNPENIIARVRIREEKHQIRAIPALERTGGYARYYPGDIFGLVNERQFRSLKWRFIKYERVDEKLADEIESSKDFPAAESVSAPGSYKSIVARSKFGDMEWIRNHNNDLLELCIESGIDGLKYNTAIVSFSSFAESRFTKALPYLTAYVAYNLGRLGMHFPSAFGAYALDLILEKEVANKKEKHPAINLESGVKDNWYHSRAGILYEPEQAKELINLALRIQ